MSESRLYTDLAPWWPLLSPKEDYREEAAEYVRLLRGACPHAKTLLELGSGGGHNAFYMKPEFELTLVDLAPRMLEASKELNPECRHVAGDMRSIRLQSLFDAVFVHDAIMSMETLEDLERVIRTAHVHCKPGGCVLVAPDYFRETFRPYTHHGGSDGTGRALRYLEWAYDPDPDDDWYRTDFLFVLHLEDGTVQHEYERHKCTLFTEQKWMDLFDGVGFAVELLPLNIASSTLRVFIGTKNTE